MIIALGVKKQVGKDTVAQYLQEKYGFQRLAFADKLKAEADIMLRAIGLSYNEEDKENLRPILIGLGEMRRNFSANYWLGSVIEQILEGGLDKNWVITDMRYPNEAAALKKMGAIIVRLNRDNDLKVEPTEDVGDLIEPDYEIDNNGKVEELQVTIEKILETEKANGIRI